MNEPMTSEKINASAQRRSSFNQDTSTTVMISQDILTDPLKVLYLFQCFQEAQDRALCDVLSDSFHDDEVKISGNVLPHQLASLGFFLSSSNRKWKRLALTKSVIRDHGIQLLHRYLCGDLTNEQKIEVIDLTSNYLTRTSSPLIGDIIVHTQPHTVILNDNCIHIVKDISAAIAAAIAATTTVKVLNMTDNGLCTSQELPAVHDMISRLEELDISGNELDDGAAVVLSEGIKLTTTLRSLVICRNEISAVSAKLIADSLMYNTTLEVLNMSHNNIGEDGIVTVAKSIAVNNVLKELHIHANRIKTVGATATANYLTINTSLEVLHIDANIIGDDGAASIARAIAWNKTLKKLFISHNKITSTGAISIARSLAQNTSLEKLDISENDIHKDGAKHLLKQLVTIAH
ncbi:leucine-rich repeat-containing protein 74B-like [Dysidea avara]|uniref:leucine-rich repeat-containing protein 74B-like n=1 Tax=Dysidea avara TaxID=196820 RepID=UPI00332BF6F6